MRRNNSGLIFLGVCVVLSAGIIAFVVFNLPPQTAQNQPTAAPQSGRISPTPFNVTGFAATAKAQSLPITGLWEQTSEQGFLYVESAKGDNFSIVDQKTGLFDGQILWQKKGQTKQTQLIYYWSPGSKLTVGYQDKQAGYDARLDGQKLILNTAGREVVLSKRI